MKTIVITGANSGIGLEVTRQLAEDKNKHLLLGCRDTRKAQSRIDKIKASSGNKHLTVIPLDLSSFSSIRSFTKGVIEASATIDVLACNAGLQIPTGTKVSKEGFEETFAVNVLGHFLLTKLLLPHIHKPSGRIVLTSSGTHFNPPIWQSRMFGMPGANYKGWKEISSPDGFRDYKEGKRGFARYSTSKLCTLLFGYELDKKLQCTDAKITINMFDPGLMPGTGLARETSPAQQWMWKNVMPVMRIFNGINSVQTSSKNLSALIADAKFDKITGKYFEEQKVKPSSNDSYNTDYQKDLWEGCEHLIGEPFEPENM